MTKLMLTFSTAILTLGMAVQANAQTSVDNDPAPNPDAGSGTSSFSANALAQVTTTGTVVLGKNFTIQPGHYEDFRLGTNYTLDASSRVAISILAAKYNLPGTYIVPYFAAPGAAYAAVDLIDASGFNFTTQGGNVVWVYGSHLVVRVYNFSDHSITYNQLMVHWAGN